MTPCAEREKIDGDWDGTVAESYTNITVEQHGKAIETNSTTALQAEQA